MYNVVALSVETSKESKRLDTRSKGRVEKAKRGGKG